MEAGAGSWLATPHPHSKKCQKVELSYKASKPGVSDPLLPVRFHFLRTTPLSILTPCGLQKLSQENSHNVNRPIASNLK